MKGKWLYIVVFLSVLCVSILVHLPATWLYAQFPTMRAFQLDGVTGTPWKGSADHLVINQQDLGQVYWEFEPSKLLMAKAQFTVRLGRGSEMKLNAKGEVGVGLSGAYASNVMASMPLEQIIKRLPAQQFPLDLTGQIEVAIKQFNYTQPWCEQANGNLVWTNGQIESPLGTLTPGPVIADLICQQQNITLDGKQNSDQVSSAFNVELNDKAQYKLTAWFKPGTKFPSSMGQQLKWLGNPNPQGQYPFTYAGKL